jgi:ABC-type transport system involved in cytochrome c biogenesis permease subunit
MKTRAMPFVILLLAALYVGVKAVRSSAPPDQMRLDVFGEIPVAHGGRVKPIDSLARNLLRVVSDRETFEDGQGKSQPAVRWLLDVMVDAQDPEKRARKHKVVRIYDLDLLNELKLERRKYYRYAIDEFADRLPDLGERVQKAREKKENEQKLDRFETHLLEFVSKLEYYEAIARLAIPHVVPPADGTNAWKTLAEAKRASDPAADAFLAIRDAYAEGDVAQFNEAVRSYASRLSEGRPSDSRKGRFEAYFNEVDPFNVAKWLYFLAFALTALSWLGWEKALNRSALWLVALTFSLHTLALVGRIYLSGRPPVTNLYSSAVFIGWGCVLLGMILERLYKLGVGNTIASISGFATLLIAHILAAEGDTMAVLQAVLDTQFWLATHVTCITMGYSTTYVAGLIGMLLILRGVLTPSLTPELRASMARMMYGAICFGTFFSFVGTVLGGLWADDSWGRFWGWDPKENGALMIVLWNALILHARWGGMIRDRGLAILSVVGNVIVSWSWFGVNELGVGLHSYGFTEGRAFWLVLFVVSQAVVAGLGMLPPESWRSRPPEAGAHAEKSVPSGP